MTTEIQRIPGSFNLPNNWPRVEIIDLESDLFAHYYAGAADYNGTDGWTDRAGNADLSIVSDPSPSLASNPAGVSFIETSGHSLASPNLASTYSGPLTVSGVFRWATGSTVETTRQVFSTAAGAGAYFGLHVNESTGNLVARTEDGGGMVYAAMPENQYCAVVAVFDGANSSLTIDGSTVAGALPAGNMSVIRLGNNSTDSFPLYGRIAEMRIHTRALSTSEIAAVTSELSTSWGL